MKFEEFKLEREQSTWENKVDFNLSESGVHPRSIKTLFDPSFIEKIENMKKPTQTKQPDMEVVAQMTLKSSKKYTKKRKRTQNIDI